jgi:hypothetical protein
MPIGQIVDTDSAQEFMKEALGKITETEINAIADELEIKSQKFRQLLKKDVIKGLEGGHIRALLRSVFSTRRRADDLLGLHGVEALKENIHNLLYGAEPLPARFQTFYDALEKAQDYIRFDLAGELLHYNFPEDCWLWTRWVWDPKTQTGALPLVTMEGYDFAAPTMGETYMKVGEATLFVKATGDATGFTRIGKGPFGINVYFACVYAVYIYTTVRMRMTQEFNKVIPGLPEMCRRLLGVHRMEV